MDSLPSASSRLEHASAVAKLAVNESPSETLSSRCTQCNPRPKETGRNLAICIDGTSNQFGQNNTNVVKLFAKINLDPKSANREQHAYYSSGIGTRPKPLHIIDRIERSISDRFDMAVAWNVEEIVKDAYGWLARTYQEGDQIYLFGFSRGAYQVRVLAGMIQEVGLIKTPTERQIGTAYDHYEAISSGQPKTKQIAREFKNTFSWKELRVHFVGVWDTVSSVGLIKGDVFLSKSSSATHACHFRHALALDERRVKFMPEYLHEMNSQPDDGTVRSATSNTGENITGSPSESRSLGSGDNDTYVSDKKKSNIKEVWFAGCHSDVGGKNRPGRSQQAGNVSLVWMRREATANGLVLAPTDIVWVPDDLGSGTSSSMTLGWRTVEYLPIKHQVSFSGVGEHAFGLHRLQPRRIIPGQKVHASVLYANAYKPKAMLGEGFEIPVVQRGLEDAEPTDQIWENGLFDDTAADELLTCLSSQQGIAPIYLDRLLFMLRFREGKQCIRKVPDWQAMLIKLIGNQNCAPLVWLVAVVAYFEASCDHATQQETCALLPSECLSHFDGVRQCLSGILEKHKHRDAPRVVTLLRPLTKHPILRERILTKDVLEILVEFLDAIAEKPKKGFGQAMDGLSCLLKCDDTREFFVARLKTSPPGSNKSRLSQILDINDSRLLTATLRMVLTLVQTLPKEEARDVCSAVKPKIQKLATKRERLVGHLAVEILFVISDLHDWNHLNVRDPRVRTNLASVLDHPNLNSNDSVDGKGSNVDPRRDILCHIFGLGAPELNGLRKGLIGELKNAVRKGRARERTAATMILLKLCETTAIRNRLCEIELLEVFVNQLQHKDSALLAAYALVTCLDYDDMKESIKKNKNLPKYIVIMLRRDYFDDAVGPVEGFQIFRCLMQHADLRGTIKDQEITDVLNKKLEKGKPKETRTSLICLDIFRSFDPDGPWTVELVSNALKHLRSQEWRVQKAGVTILCALAQTDHGVAVIRGQIHEIVEMLLPRGYLPIESTASQPTPVTSPRGSQGHPAASTHESSELRDTPSHPSSWMLGPACALRNLAQNETLRTRVRKTPQYGILKDSYLSGTLVNEADTSSWRVKTPTRDDVTNMLDKMIKAVDKEISEEGLMSIGDTVLPHISHWDRLATLISNRTVAAVTVLPALLGVSALAISAVIVVTPVYVSIRAYDILKRLLSRYLGNWSLIGSHGDASEVEHLEDETGPDQTTHPGEGTAPSPRGGEDPAGATGEEHSQDVGTSSPEVVEIQRFEPTTTMHTQNDGKGKAREVLE